VLPRLRGKLNNPQGTFLDHPGAVLMATACSSVAAAFSASVAASSSTVAKRPKSPVFSVKPKKTTNKQKISNQ
jgi:hypothetical protein